MLDHLIEFGQLYLLVFVELLHYQLLSVNAVIHLLFELLEGSCHPMVVVVCRLDALELHLFLYFSPYLAHLEVRVHLNYLEFLLLVGG